ncbi:MAG TPA: hypothetical protein H9822_03115 [Candidatus Yaniella excrementavium]|nr:hypothetical protein [Candidatus Yaniella excrementavium]
MVDTAGLWWEHRATGSDDRPSEEFIMRYLLSWHIREEEMINRSPAWREEIVAFLARFEDELFTHSELDWVEVLDPESQAIVVGPGGDVRAGFYNEGGKPSARVWAIRVESKERAREIAATFAGQLDTWIEVRECLPGAQRP